MSLNKSTKTKAKSPFAKTESSEDVPTKELAKTQLLPYSASYVEGKNKPPPQSWLGKRSAADAELSDRSEEESSDADSADDDSGDELDESLANFLQRVSSQVKLITFVTLSQAMLSPTPPAASLSPLLQRYLKEMTSEIESDVKSLLDTSTSDSASSTTKQQQ